MERPTLPANLQRLTLPTGVHRRWLKSLWFGRYKGGKSFALASFPKPLLAIDRGEGGIAMFLPKDDPDYVCVVANDPQTYNEIVDWAIAHEDWLSSVVDDSLTSGWTDHMEAWEEKLGTEDIKGGQWSKVKKPWKLNLRRLMRANFHLGYSAWTKEVEYSESPGGPGERAGLLMKSQNVPAVERTVGYTVDAIFECSTELNAKNEPTPIHYVTYWGGRRPASVSPTELYLGKKWRFDERKPVSVWDTVLAPFLPKWEENGGEHLGVDPQEARHELGGLEDTFQDAEMGEILRLIAACPDLAAFQAASPALMSRTNQLSQDRRGVVSAAGKQRRKELGG